MNIKLLSIPFNSNIDLESIKLTLNNIPLLTLQSGFNIYEVTTSSSDVDNLSTLSLEQSTNFIFIKSKGGIDIYVGLFTHNGTLIKEGYWAPDCGDTILYKSIEEQLMFLLDN